jgi:hypothetical protein
MNGDQRRQPSNLHRFLVENVIGRHGVSLKVIRAELKISDKTLKERNLRGSPGHVRELIDVVRRLYGVNWRTEMEGRIWLAAGHSPPSVLAGEMNDVERFAYEKLYHFEGGWARAVRLWGADGQNQRVNELKVEYLDKALKIDPALQDRYTAAIENKRKAAAEENKLFFNGPNTRLVDWNANVLDGPGAARERETVTLILGPVGWYDYVGLNDTVRVLPGTPHNLDSYRYYAGFEDVVERQIVTSSRLSNIIETVTTMVTRDGYVGYQRRGSAVFAAATSKTLARYTSATAENINRWRDDVYADASLTRVNREDLSSKNERPDHTYRPKGVPHPFAAVESALLKEGTPKLSGRFSYGTIRFTGLSFDLEVMHPNALFVAFIDATKDEILSMRRVRPGEEAKEGGLEFVLADPTDSKTNEVMKMPGWTGAGLASLIRTFEFIDAYMTSNHVGFDGMFNHMIADLRR